MSTKNMCITEAELDFLEEYRETPEYQDALTAFNKKMQWRVKNHKEATDGRNVLIVESLQDGLRVLNQIIIEPHRIDEFIEKTLEAAEKVRAAEQERAAEIKG